MPTFPTLWAIGARTLYWSDDYGYTWTEIDRTAIGSGNYINGLCGPGTEWKIYTCVDSNSGIWYYNGSWTQEDSVDTYCYSDRTRAVSLWCSQDDSIVICAGAGATNQYIRTRDGLPGTSWTNEFTVNTAQSELPSCVHGTPDGSAIFATTALWNNGGDITARLLKRETNGTWTEVASISPSGYTIFTELRVVSATEVWIVGADGSAPTNYGKIWKWNGSTLSQEYQFNLSSYNRTGIWISEDGTEGWAVSYWSGPSQSNEYHYYNGSTWSSDQAIENVAITTTITQRDGIPASAVSGGGAGHVIPYDGADWDNSYFPSIEIFDVQGLLLTYIEEYTAPVEPPYESPFRNQSPVSGYSRVPIYQNLIQFDVISTTCQLASNTIDAYVNDVLALSNETFYSPFDGPDAYLGAIVSDDGYDGYRIILDYTDTPWGKSQLVNIDIYVEDMCDGYIDDSWSFTTTEYIGGHFLIGQNNPDDEPGNVGPGLHFEEGVGWGAFPEAIDPTVGSSTYISYHMDSNNIMNNVWVGMYHGSTNIPTYLIMHWDGTGWTKHAVDLSSGTPYGGGSAVSRVPGTNTVFVSANMYNGRHNMWIKYDGSAWSVIRGRTNRWHYVPLSIDENTCVWAGYDHDDVNPNYYITTNTTTHTRYSGSDLPSNIGFVGISRLANGDIFLFSENGYVYRSSSIYGPFVIDNQTDGPFSGGYNSDSIFSMNSSADGQFLVIQSRSSGSYWVRDGIDNWASYNAGGSYFYFGQPAAINRQLLLRGNSSSIARVSYDGGQNWQNVEQSQSRSSCAFIDDISSNKRLVSLCDGDNFSSAPQMGVWWRGDAPHSPWAYWRSVKTNPNTAGSISAYAGIQGFETGHLVLSCYRKESWRISVAHYNPATETWQGISFPTSPTNYSYCVMNVFGTEYSAGKIHGLLYGQNFSTLDYARWNGSSYDISSIPGSSRGTWASGPKAGYNIQADSYGTDIWITAGENQLWHSDDGGTSWVNRHSAASAIHVDAYDAKDVFIISSNEVYISIAGASPETHFSKWDGYSWSVAAPSIDKDSGSRSIFVDKENDLWFFESNSSSSPTETYLLVDGYWILQDTFSWGGGSRDVTGIESFPDDSMMAISMSTPSAPSSYGDGSILTNANNDELGWSTLRGFGSNVKKFVGMSYMSLPISVNITYSNSSDVIYSGGFRSPYTNSTIEFNNRDGYDGYDFTIINDGNFSAGETTISVVIDGYENAIYDIYPQEGAIDVNSSSEIRFRIRKNGA